MIVIVEIDATRFNKRPMILTLAPGYSFGGKQVFTGTNQRGTAFQAYIPYFSDDTQTRYLWDAMTIIPLSKVGSSVGSDSVTILNLRVQSGYKEEIDV